VLQLANGTELLVDETRMDEGQLNETGVMNLKAMAGISQTGKLDFDFGNFGTPPPGTNDLCMAFFRFVYARVLL